MAQKTPGIHAGHRARHKARFLAAPDTFSDHELLELLLFYVIPQKDTNELAHLLIKRFGSLPGVFEASAEELQTVDGMGESAAILFRSVMQIFRRCVEVRCVESKQDLRVEDAIRLDLTSKYLGAARERVWLAGLDSKWRIVGIVCVGDGDLSSAEADMKRVLNFVSEYSPKYVILSHNHPSGVGLPSDADLFATQRMEGILKGVGVELYDHLIFDDSGDYLSFRESKFLGDGRRICSYTVDEVRERVFIHSAKETLGHEVISAFLNGADEHKT